MDSTYIALIVVTLINAAGWLFTLYRNGKSAAKQAGKYEERVKNLDERMDDLPCQTNPHYLTEFGAFFQKTKDNGARLERIENKLNSH